jgi:hypothetical protein
MDVIIMPSTISLISKLQADYPKYCFKSSDEFRWSPEECTIYYKGAPSEPATLLHELSHALLAHTTYVKDINLIELERDAWQYARSTLAPIYSLTIPEDAIQDSLDTYRDWLHARSTCPVCKAIGLQIKASGYKCIVCGTHWRVNDARTCALRRYSSAPQQ